MAGLIAAVLVLAALTAWSGYYVLRLRAERHQRGILRPWPIRPIALDEFDPVFRTGPLGPSLATEVHFVGRGPLPTPGATSDEEAWILAVLARSARAMFEFGTCTGRTTYLWARNAPPDAEIVTLTLAPDQLADYAEAPGDAGRDTRAAMTESAFTRFLYSGTPVETRITQLFGDSKQLDETRWLDHFDLIFVDGSHAYSYVKSDSAKALRMLRPGGIVLWHDYGSPRRVRGVFRALNELAMQLPLVHIRGTTFVAWRKPAAE